MDWTAVIVAFIAGPLAAGLTAWALLRQKRHEVEVEEGRGVVDGYHNLTGDTMARIAQLTARVKEVETDNESLRCRVRDLETKMGKLMADMSAERAVWTSQQRRLERVNEQLRERLEALRAVTPEYSPAVHDDIEGEGGGA